MVLQTKICPRCKVSKDILFFRKRANKNWYEAYCKVCAVEYTKLWQRRHPAKIRQLSRRAYLFKRYKWLDSSNYSQMYSKQNGMCGICGIKKDMLVIDHNHSNNKIRGLLCNNCNTGIGLLKENPQSLLRAISWINTCP